MFDKLDTNIIDGMERGLLSTVFFDNETTTKRFFINRT